MTVRLLATGFTPFPGAPVNPTEHLIRCFEKAPPLDDAGVEWRFAVLPVDYADAVPALEEAARGFDPHIAIHFGLAQEAAGFRLETVARNEIAARIPDNSGFQPGVSRIRRDAGHVASTLPLREIADALAAGGHGVEWSGDAGGYLCNYVFYHSAAGLCRGLAAPMSGFIHVGPVSDLQKLLQGAGTIIETCITHFRNR